MLRFLCSWFKIARPCGCLCQLEGEATARAIRLAQFVNTPLYVVHVMSKDALEEISRARQSGKSSSL